ncbi:hypothetical protein DL769_005898 [Monosporascus sp. CRB-8-3]|nr:hypothetical protein DL769_005898 [Monosporascus sp. CRB-8-3]
MGSASGSRSRIAELATIISQSVAKLDEMLSVVGMPSPSFDEDAPEPYPAETDDVRDAVIDAAAELYDLLLEPMHNNMVCLQAITRFGIANMVPSGGQISFADIAAQVPGLSEPIVRRLLRHAITMRVFREPEAGMVAHTKASKALQVKPVLNAWLRNGTHEMWPAAVRMVDALQKWPDSSEPSETGFALANNTIAPAFTILGSDPARAARFAYAMSIYSTKPEYSPAFLTDHYDWEALITSTEGLQQRQQHQQQQPVRVIAVGGGGYIHVAIELVRRFANLDVTVQDMAAALPPAVRRQGDNNNENDGEGVVPAELRGRLRLAVVDDLFAPQTARGIDVFLIRSVLHLWPNKYCLRLLRAQIPALRPGARVLIQDVCMPEPGTVALWREQDLRASDVHMANLFNGQERTVKEWTALLAEADPRFVVKQVIEPKGSALGIIEAVWNATD